MSPIDAASVVTDLAVCWEQLRNTMLWNCSTRIVFAVWRNCVITVHVYKKNKVTRFTVHTVTYCIFPQRR
uniref:Uncharacterized protein n=1 Tax=Anguilla anguilla TaxID=7936 RepID=A0A0E9X749_ANGAN